MTGQQREDLKQLFQLGVVTIPSSLVDWKDNWKSVNLAGVALSALLPSAGIAPAFIVAIGVVLAVQDLIPLGGVPQ